MKKIDQPGPFILKSVCWIMIAVMSSSCATTSLWRSTDPNETVELRYDDMTEEALIEDGFTFTRDDSKELFFIHKSAGEKRKDYALRAIGTPFTVALDAFLIGFLAVGLTANETPPESVNWDTTLMEWGYH